MLTPAERGTGKGRLGEGPRNSGFTGAYFRRGSLGVVTVTSPVGHTLRIWHFSTRKSDFHKRAYLK